MSSNFATETTALTAIVVEDEPDLRREICDSLMSLWPDLKIVGQAQDGLAALELVAEKKPGMVFLDIQIPELNGLEVARRIGDQCHIVFITAYDAHALEAFEKGAVDYILKPLQNERLALTVQRLKKKLPQAPVAMSTLVDEIQAPPRSRYIRWITASVGNTFHLVMTSDILFFQADKRYTRVVLSNSEVFIPKTLKELMDELDPEQFWQVHRSAIVNSNEIASIEPDVMGRFSIKLKSRQERLPVSDAFMRKFRKM